MSECSKFCCRHWKQLHYSNELAKPADQQDLWILGSINRNASITTNEQRVPHSSGAGGIRNEDIRHHRCTWRQLEEWHIHVRSGRQFLSHSHLQSPQPSTYRICRRSQICLPEEVCMNSGLFYTAVEGTNMIYEFETGNKNLYLSIFQTFQRLHGGRFVGSVPPESK